MSRTPDRVEYVEPTPQARLAALLALALALATLPGSVFFVFWPQIQAHFRGLPACELIAWLRALGHGASALAGGLGLDRRRHRAGTRGGCWR